MLKKFKKIGFAKIAVVTGFLAALLTVINFFLPVSKVYRLNNKAAGLTLVNKEPMAFSPQENHVCLAHTGTKIRLLGDPKEGEFLIMWQKVAIEDGFCKDKVGWVSLENIEAE